MKKIFSIAILLIFSILTLAGCGNNATAPTGAQESKPLKKLKVGFSPTGAILTEIAAHQGYFKEEGLDIEFVQFSSTADGLAALNSGKVDLGVSFGTAAPLTLINNGADLVIIGGHLSGGHPVLATQETASKIHSLEDYKGKTIATPRLYTPDVVWRGAMHQAGIDIKEDMNVIEMKSPVPVMEAVLAGKADIGICSTMVYTRAKQAGLAIIGWSNDFFHDHPCCRIVARGPAVQQDPDAYRAFMRALIRAEKTRKENPELAVEVIKKVLKLDDDMARDFALEPHQILTSDPDRNGVLKLWQYMQDIGYVQAKLDVSQHINTELYHQALGDLQKKYPDEQFFKGLETRYIEQNQ